MPTQVRVVDVELHEASPPTFSIKPAVDNGSKVRGADTHADKATCPNRTPRNSTTVPSIQTGRAASCCTLCVAQVRGPDQPNRTPCYPCAGLGWHKCVYYVLACSKRRRTAGPMQDPLPWSLLPPNCLTMWGRTTDNMLLLAQVRLPSAYPAGHGSQRDRCCGGMLLCCCLGHLG